MLEENKEILVNKNSHKTYNEQDYEVLFNAVKNYEDRIKEIEQSSYWKIYLFLTKAKLVLTSDSYLKSDKWKFFQRLRFLFSKLGIFLIGKFFRQLFLMFFGKVNSIIGFGKGSEQVTYQDFKAKNFPRSSDLELMKNNVKHFAIKPTFDIFIIVTSSNFKYLNRFLHELEKQVYLKFTIRFLVVHPTDIIKYTLTKIAESDQRVSFETIRNDFEHKPKTQQDFILVTKLNSILAPHCLFHFVNQINNYPEADFIYPDNDFYSNNNYEETNNPYFKPNWSPHTLLSRNYIGGLFLVSSELYSKSQLQSNISVYSMVLNLTKNARYISHIHKVLYHQKEDELTSENIKKNHQALNTYLSANYPLSYAKLSDTSLGCFCPVFKLNENPLVSIIIPAKDKATILEACIDSVLEQSTYKNFEIIIVDNGSSENSFFSTIAQYEFKYPEIIKSIRIDIPFNYSILNNKAAQIAKGDYLLFLNNDTKLISPDLIQELLKLAQLDNVGAVGPKLLYPNNTIQHAGIVLSLDETGAHVYSGAHKDTSGYFNNTNCLTNYSAVTGACMMIKKEKFNMVGGFDETLAVDCNDVELCCKLYTVGFFNVYVPWVSMFHYECLTRGNPMLSSSSMKRQNIEKKYFIDKWGDMIKNDPFYNKNLSRESKNYDLNNA